MTKSSFQLYDPYGMDRTDHTAYLALILDHNNWLMRDFDSALILR